MVPIQRVSLFGQSRLKHLGGAEDGEGVQAHERAPGASGRGAPGAGPYQAKSIGELPTCPVAPAVANAVFDAIGVRITDLPITGEKIIKALKESGPAQGRAVTSEKGA